MPIFSRRTLIGIFVGFHLVVLPVQAQTSQVDPDIFANKQNFTGAPHFVRTTVFAAEHVAGNWPFLEKQGDLTCISVDGIAMAFFETENSDEPFMLAENMIMVFIGRLVTGASEYIDRNYDPAKLVVDLEKTYNAALVQCGPPYAQ